MIDQQPRSTTLLAETEVQTYYMSIQKYQQLLEERPKLSNKVVRAISIEISTKLRLSNIRASFRNSLPGDSTRSCIASSKRQSTPSRNLIHHICSLTQPATMNRVRRCPLSEERRERFHVPACEDSHKNSLLSDIDRALHHIYCRRLLVHLAPPLRCALPRAAISTGSDPWTF